MSVKAIWAFKSILTSPEIVSLGLQAQSSYYHDILGVHDKLQTSALLLEKTSSGNYSYSTFIYRLRVETSPS